MNTYLAVHNVVSITLTHNAGQRGYWLDVRGYDDEGNMAEVTLFSKEPIEVVTKGDK